MPTLGKNRTVLGQLIGASNYDVGHIALGVNGGGVAYLGVIGGDYKGGGCTGLPEPKGDFFAIDYVAHEIGHQFGGNHTFNGALGACGGNISDAVGRARLGLLGDGLRRHLRPGRPPAAHRPLLLVPHRRRGLRDDRRRSPTTTSRSRRCRCAASATRATRSPSGFGGETTDPIVAGTNYTRAGIEAAIEEVVDRRVSIAQWGFDEFDYDSTSSTAPDETGFQVIFNASPERPGRRRVRRRRTSWPSTNGSAGVSGFVGETARGGPSQNDGSLPGRRGRQHQPVGLGAGEDKVVPIRTPFALTRVGQRRRRRRAGLPLGADQLRRGHPSARHNTKVYGPLFRVFGDDAVVTDEDTLKSPVAGHQPRRREPDPGLPRHGAGAGRQHQRRHRRACPHADRRRCPTGSCPDTLLDCYSEFLPDSRLPRQLLDADDREDELPAHRPRPAPTVVAWPSTTSP